MVLLSFENTLLHVRNSAPACVNLCKCDAQIDFFVDFSWKCIKLAILGDPDFLAQILGDFGIFGYLGVGPGPPGPRHRPKMTQKLVQKFGVT